MADYRKMYWVMTVGEERTLAMTEDEKVAKWIAENYPAECIVRFAFVH